MGTSPDYPPYEYYDTSSGQEQIVGFDIDIANYIAEEPGFNLRVVGMNFSGLIPALQANRVDFVMAGMTPTEERKQNVDFSEVYWWKMLPQLSSSATPRANGPGSSWKRCSEKARIKTALPELEASFLKDLRPKQAVVAL
ncbi:transporter substrate-binding domain-containing protein [Synechococcus bigranulatus str. 'Rupite']|uniref:Transporter substrate-binding domain-containing protein n=1 Tax=Thermostichus vulcanus str. 'Rupite' TaxID=2813851 RepID=A0ABT0CEM7_THEVL|nr:transporter substrate-binding domain-containing protein [Thermostichus vulcanus str. 'Rupite']